MSYRKYYQYTLRRETDTIVAQRNPAGWDAAGITFTRNDVYNSVLRSGIPELKFVKDLKIWLDQQITNYGISSDVDIEIIIYQINPITLAYDVLFFQGILDLKTYKKERYFTTCDCIDNSKLAKFIARDDLEIEYNRTETINGESVDAITDFPITISLPGIDLFRNAIVKLYDSVNTFSTPGYTKAFISSILEYVNDFPSNVELNNDKVYTNTDIATAYVNILANFLVDIEVTFVGAGELTITPNIKVTDGANTPYSYDFPDIIISGDSETKYVDDVVPVDMTDFEVNAGYYIEMTFDCVVTSGTALFLIYFTADKSKILEKSETPGVKTCNGFLPHELGIRLLQIITDETDSSKLLYSELLGRTDSQFRTYASDGNGAYMFLTNGYYIRRLNQKAFKTTFKNFFKALKSWYPAGLWYDATNDYFVIESISEFYQNTEILDLGEVKDLVIRPATDIYYNNIKTGYQKKVEYKEYNGVNEINTPAEYTTVISTIKNTLDVQNPFRGDSVGIELAKRAGQFSKDTDYDNDNFVIDCKLDGGNVIVNQDTVATSDDIPGVSQYFNLRFTPKQILKNNADLFTPCLEKNQSSYIRFANNQQDNDLTIGTDTEKGNLQAFGIYSPYILPRIYDFKHPMTNDIVNQLNTNPHGYITFTNNGVTYHMFLLECGKGGYRKEGNWLGIEANLS